MSTRLADRLSAARRRRFIGRSSEKQLFQAALGAPEPPFYVLYIFGPGGIGKSSLLREYGDMAQQAGAQTLYLDGRTIEPTPDSFLAHLTNTLGLAPSEDAVGFLLARKEQTVFLVDTFEALTPLETWLRDIFLPQLPGNTLAVFAARFPPSQGWRTDPGWSDLLRVLPLRNLTPDESSQLLSLRTVPSQEHAHIVAFTHGHPLAISLVADVLDQNPGLEFEPKAMPDIIRTLLERLIQDAPDADHRVALEACALVQYMNEALLSEMLGKSDTHDLFEWLRRLSFMDAGRYGLFPHDLVRETLTTDLQWRNPDWFAELHMRARHYYHERIKQTQGQSQRRVLNELVYLHRDNAAVRQFFEFTANEAIWTDNANQTDIPRLIDMVRRHERNESARLAEFWFEHQPRATLVIRNNERLPIGFLTLLSLTDASPEEIAADPAAQAAWAYLQTHAPIRPGERVTYFRFWMDGDSYQGLSSTQSRIFLICVQHYLNTPGLAYTLLPVSQPEFYAPAFAYADLTRLPDADFTVNGQRFGLYGHDWRITPPSDWLQLLAERELAMAAAMPQQAAAPKVSQPVLVLSEPEFAEAVRAALRNYTRVDGLRDNPLVRSRLVVERAGANASTLARAQVLQSLTKEATDLLQSSPKLVKLHRAVHHTYIQPAATQELAAEVLDLPFSTYRRHLKEGIDLIIETLWNRELNTLGA